MRRRVVVINEEHEVVYVGGRQRSIYAKNAIPPAGPRFWVELEVGQPFDAFGESYALIPSDRYQRGQNRMWGRVCPDNAERVNGSWRGRR